MSSATPPGGGKERTRSEEALTGRARRERGSAAAKSVLYKQGVKLFFSAFLLVLDRDLDPVNHYLYEVPVDSVRLIVSESNSKMEELVTVPGCD